MSKIVIIDSGVAKDVIGNCSGYNLIDYSLNIEDDLGHGTAVAYQISKQHPYLSIFIIKLFDKEHREISEEKLIEALDWIYNQLDDYILIHISAGIKTCDNYYQLEKICKKFFKKNIFIVSAFDNAGCMSFPAAFENVIGVDYDVTCVDASTYIHIKNSPVNFKAKGIDWRLPNEKGHFCTVSGSSFAAPVISNKIIDLYYRYRDYNVILKKLIEGANRIEENPKLYVNNGPDFHINEAIVLPYNKEIQTLVLNQNKLKFEIKEIVEIGISQKQDKYTSIAYKNINWADKHFDTVILGHLEVLEKATNLKITENVIKNCLMYRKNLYAFDDISSYKDILNEFKKNGISYYYYPVKQKINKTSTVRRLYNFSTPVLGVVGTSPRQGKLTLQVNLKSSLENVGYKCGFFSTEQSGFLYGADCIFPNGYGSGNSNESINTIILINKMMHSIDIKGYDIILVGFQSQIIPYSLGNIGFYPLAQHDQILATCPDGFILTVNYDDAEDYIERAINYLNSIVYGEVIAIYLFGYKIDRLSFIQHKEPVNIEKDLLSAKARSLVEKFGIPVFFDNQYSELIETIENFFQE